MTDLMLYRMAPPIAWLALFMATLALLFAMEGVAMRLYDLARPPVTMTWRPEMLPDGRYAVRFSGFKHRGECDLAEIRAWGRTSIGDARIDIQREGPARNLRLTVGPFGPGAPWVLVPPPIGTPRIVAEFDCRGRNVLVEVQRQ